MLRSADVVIVGAGPAGLSCALTLGRCRRKVLIFDTGRQRNRSTKAMHGFISRDGEHPLVFLNKAKKELLRYKIRIIKKEVLHAEKVNGGFNLRTSGNEHFFCRKLVIATGLVDELPPIKQINRYYGRSVFHCPYCDGWEARNKKWVVYSGKKNAAIEICLLFCDWTSDITLLANDHWKLGKQERQKLETHGITITTSPAVSLKGLAGKISQVVLRDSSEIPADVLFFSNKQVPQNRIATMLGCECSKTGAINFNRKQQTKVPGLFVAGDVGRDMHLVIIAAAEGAKAGVVINTELNREMRV
jgi:thioredoxin reductase